MATLIWTGTTTARKQVTQVTVSDAAEGDVIRLTINGQEISYEVGASDTVSDIMSGLVTAIGNSNAPEWSEVSASSVSQQERQTVEVTGASGGTFTLDVDGATTGTIDYNATKAEVEDAINAVLTGGVTCSVLDGPLSTNKAIVEFSDTAGHTEMTANTGSLTGSAPAVTIETTQAGGTVLQLQGATAGKPFVVTGSTSGDGANEVQTVTIGNSPTGGTFDLTIDLGSGDETASGIAYNASPSALQTALEGLASIDPGDVAVTGSAGNWSVEFQGQYAGANVNPFTADGSSLTGGDAQVTVEVIQQGAAGTNAVQTITMDTAVSGGTWTISDGVTTSSAIAFDASDATVQTAVEEVYGAGNVAIAGGPLNTSGSITATFQGDLAASVIPRMTVDASSLTGAADDVSAADQQTGVNGTNEEQVIRFRQNDYGLVVTLVGESSDMVFTPTQYGDAAITHDATTTAELTAALESISTIGEGNVQVTYEPDESLVYEQWRIEFINDLAATNQPELQIEDWDFWREVATEKQQGGGGINEVQNAFPLRWDGAGEIRVAFNGSEYSDWLDTSDAAGAIEADEITALFESLSTIEPGDVEVTAGTPNLDDDGNGGEFDVEFTGQYADTNLPLMSVQVRAKKGSENATVFTAATGVPGTNAIHRLTGTSLTHGTWDWQLTHDGSTYTVERIDYDVTAAELETLLNAQLGTGATSCTGGPLNSATIDVEFVAQGFQSSAVSLPTIDGAGLILHAGITTPGVEGANEIVDLTLPASVHGGTGTLTIAGETTAAIDWNADAAQMKTRLEGLASIDEVTASGSWPGTIRVEFTGTEGNTDQGDITATESLDNGTVTIATDTEGTVADSVTVETVTSATGPNHVVAGNFDTGSLPTTGDTLYIPAGAPSLLYDLDTLSSVTLTELIIEQGFTNTIGLPEFNDTGAGYYEYRDTYLQVSATTLTIGVGEGQGSGRLKIDVGSNTCTMNVLNSGQPATTGIPSILWKGTDSSNVVNVQRGRVGIAVLPGESATVATLRVGYVDSQAADSNVRCGSGVSLTTVEQTGGVLSLDSATTSIDVNGGDVTVEQGSHAHAAITVDQGSLTYKSTGTLTTLTVGTGGTADFGADMQSRTVTNTTIQRGGTIRDPNKTVTWTNGIDLERCRLPDVTIDVGTHFTLTPSAI